MALSIMGLKSSGEERQIHFSGTGTVLIQSSESELMGRSSLQDVLSQITGLHKNDLQSLKQTIENRLNQ